MKKKSKETPSTFLCRNCGATHAGPALSYGAEAPAAWYEISENQRKNRSVLSSDQCVIDRKYFFIAGNIEIAIIGSEKVFRWTVWVSLTKKHYERAAALWDKVGREAEPPYFGWLSTSLPAYPDTLNLRTNVHTRPVGIRPYVELE